MLPGLKGSRIRVAFDAAGMSPHTTWFARLPGSGSKGSAEVRAVATSPHTPTSRGSYRLLSPYLRVRPAALAPITVR